MKKRKIFSQLVEELDNNKILLLIWPRQVGKTTLLKQLQEEVQDRKTFFINLEFEDKKAQLDENPLNLFEITWINSTEKQVIFIDEVQYLRNPSNFLKLIYDEYHQNVKLVVSGSSSFYIDQKFKDSLMGRKELYEIFTLNFEEFLDFQDETQIKELLFTEKKIPLGYKNRVEELFLEYVTYGGYPEVVLLSDRERKKRKLEQLSLDYIKKDIYEANVQEMDKFFALLKILASQVGYLLNMTDLSSALQISQQTVEKYLYVMRKSYCIALVKPFWTNVKAELIKMPKVFFFDVGLRNALLNNFENIKERLDKWAFFENVVRREFWLAYGIDRIKYWRDQNKNEVDVIVEEKKAYEVKFSKNLIKPIKYTSFKEKYPTIPLEFITFDEILEFVINL